MTLWEEYKHIRNKVVHDINKAKKSTTRTRCHQIRETNPTCGEP